MSNIQPTGKNKVKVLQSDDFVHAFVKTMSSIHECSQADALHILVKSYMLSIKGTHEHDALNSLCNVIRFGEKKSPVKKNTKTEKLQKPQETEESQEYTKTEDLKEANEPAEIPECDEVTETAASQKGFLTGFKSRFIGNN